MGDAITPRRQRARDLDQPVRGAIIFLGGGEEGKLRFVERAISEARRTGTRLWNVDVQRARRSVTSAGMGSLNIFLGARPVVEGGQPSTNENWILDLWALAVVSLGLDVSPAERIRVAQLAETSEPEPTLELAPPSSSNGHGRRSLALRVVEAFLVQDEEGLLELASEIETLERGGQR